MKYLLLTLLIFSLPCAAFDLKGVQIGSALNETQLKNILGVECTEYSTMCSGYGTVLGRVTQILVNTRGSKIANIMALPAVSSYDTLLESLLKKNGTAKIIEQSDWHTTEGVLLKNTLTVWVDVDGNRMTLIKYGDAMHSMLGIISYSQLTFEAANRKAAKEDL